MLKNFPLLKFSLLPFLFLASSLFTFQAQAYIKPGEVEGADNLERIRSLVSNTVEWKEEFAKDNFRKNPGRFQEFLTKYFQYIGKFVNGPETLKGLYCGLPSDNLYLSADLPLTKDCSVSKSLYEDKRIQNDILFFSGLSLAIALENLGVKQVKGEQFKEVTINNQAYIIFAATEKADLVFSTRYFNVNKALPQMGFVSYSSYNKEGKVVNPLLFFTQLINSSSESQDASWLDNLLKTIALEGISLLTQTSKN